MPSQRKLVVFDLDDTLFPERQYVRSGYRAVAGHLLQTTGRVEHFESWLWNRFLSGQAEGAFDALSRHFGLDLSCEQISRLVEVYRNHLPQIRPYPGAAAMLAQLRPLYHMALLSDGFLPAQQLKLDATGLAHFFDQILFTEQLGRQFWKPSTVGFQKLADAYSLPPHACAYVADNPTKDFLGPNSLGWLSVQYRRPGQVYADRPAPEGGSPQIVVTLPGELHVALLRLK